jgi:hypothetical protein
VKNGDNKMMMKTTGVAVIAVLSLSTGAGWTYAQQADGAAPAPAPRAGTPPAPPALLFRMTLENTARLPLTPEVITNPNLQLQYYGDGKNIVVAIGRTEYDPHLFNGLCEKPCGLTLRDKSNYFDLTGKAKIKWTTIVSGFHRARPLIKLSDGTLLVGDQAEGSVADWQQSEISISEVRWLKLDPARGVTLGQWVANPNLSKVDEVGYFDVIPGSGVHIDGVPVEKLRAPPPGGWIALAAFELWGKPVSREIKEPQQ